MDYSRPESRSTKLVNFYKSIPYLLAMARSPSIDRYVLIDSLSNNDHLARLDCRSAPEPEWL